MYAKIDTEAPRYLDFERWWGGHVNLNAEEIQFIVDELFVGNNLAAGKIQTSDGTAVDLRNVRSPIVVFCSKGDNITPPQQALGWILDLYDDVDEIRAYGQTIVYTIHETVGHLGIFVSGSVARKEHGEFSSNIDLIDVLPPGLYEAVFEAKTEDTTSADSVSGDWVMRCEARTLDDVRALGGNDPQDERRFATAARVSEINLALYRTFVRPLARGVVSEPLAEWMHQMHPLRIQYKFFSDQNPLMAPVRAAAQMVRDNRKTVTAHNPFVAVQETISRHVVASLDAMRDMSESLAERIFLSIYGSPVLQAAIGVDPAGKNPLRKAPHSALHQQLVQARIAELKSNIANGGVREGAIRALLYVGMNRAAIDERAFETVRRIRHAQQDMPSLPLSAFKSLVREQFYMLLIDREACLAALPSLVPPNSDTRCKMLTLIREVLSARGPLTGEEEDRMRQVGQLFDLDDRALSASGLATLPASQSKEILKAS